MTLALEPLVRLRPESARRFLRAALALEAPGVAALVAAGVPHWEASDYCRRLQVAGEVGPAGWQDAARAAYADLVAALTLAAGGAAQAASGSGALAAVGGALAAAGGGARLAGLASAERPREKALRSGVDALSDGELIALLLRTGPGDEGVLAFAARLLVEHDGLVGLAGADLEALLDTHGLGPAKAAELAAAFELGRRLARAERRRRPALRTPEDVVAVLAPDLVPLRHEELWCLPLDPHSRLLGEPRVVSRGDVDGTDAGPRAFFRLALAAGATSCIAVHNHPSGDASPSSADRAATCRLVAAGRAVDVPLVDHVVIGDGGRFTSLRRTEPALFA